MTNLQPVTSSDLIIPPHDLAGTLSLPKTSLGLILFPWQRLKPSQPSQHGRRDSFEQSRLRHPSV